MPKERVTSEDVKIPELRFGGFEGAWEEKRLGEICLFIKSGKDQSQELGSFPVYGSMGQIGITDSASFQGPHILVARVGANAGNLRFVDGKFGVTDNTLILDFDRSFDIVYIFQYLNGARKQLLSRLVFGSGQPLVTSGQLKKIKFLVPKKEE